MPEGTIETKVESKPQLKPEKKSYVGPIIGIAAIVIFFFVIGYLAGRKIS